MRTFTLRASNELAASLSSAEIRSWLDDFVRQPHALPIDPGSGNGRVSLTLPEGTVNSVAASCQCPISSALRRIAFERLTNRTPGLRDPAYALKNGSATNPLPALVVNALLWILVVGMWIFSRSREKKASRRT